MKLTVLTQSIGNLALDRIQESSLARLADSLKGVEFEVIRIENSIHPAAKFSSSCKELAFPIYRTFRTTQLSHTECIYQALSLTSDDSIVWLLEDDCILLDKNEPTQNKQVVDSIRNILNYVSEKEENIVGIPRQGYSAFFAKVLFDYLKKPIAFWPNMFFANASFLKRFSYSFNRNGFDHLCCPPLQHRPAYTPAETFSIPSTEMMYAGAQLKTLPNFHSTYNDYIIISDIKRDAWFYHIGSLSTLLMYYFKDMSYSAALIQAYRTISSESQHLFRWRIKDAISKLSWIVSLSERFKDTVELFDWANSNISEFLETFRSSDITSFVYTLDNTTCSLVRRIF